MVDNLDDNAFVGTCDRLAFRFFHNASDFINY